MQLLNFTIRQMPNGLWIKERDDGRRGPCVADEALLWQALRAALDGQPRPSVDVAELVRENELLSKSCARLVADGNTVRAQATDLHNRLDDMKRENERLTKDCERLVAEKDDLHATCDRITRDCAELMADNEHLRANQRQKPGRKPRGSNAGPAGGPEALAAPEQDSLDEDL